MASGPTHIQVDPDSDLARLLDEIDSEPVILEKDGHSFRLMREPSSRRAVYDPRAAIASMRAAAGSWKDIDSEAFKAFLYRAREEGSRPEQQA